MKLHENLLLTFIKDSHIIEAVGEWALIGASFVSKIAGAFTFGADMINNSMGTASLANHEIRRSDRYPFAKKLGWSLITPAYFIDMAKDGKLPDNPYSFGSYAFDEVGSPSRKLFDDLCGYGKRDFVGPEGQLGFGGVSKSLHDVLQTEVYKPLGIKQSSYRNRGAKEQLLDLYMAIAYVQYVVWANGDAHKYDNLLQCYLLVNSFASDYGIKVTSWRDVVLQPKAQNKGLKVTGMSSNKMSANFSFNEVFYAGSMLGRKNDKPSSTVVTNMTRTVDVVQKLRDWHGKPISINSGWRSPEVNKSVNGASNSAHVIGGALDCSFSGVNKTRTAQKNLAFEVAKYLKSKGIVWDQIIYYNTFIHVGVVRPQNLKQRCEVFETGKYNSTVKRF